MNQVTKTTAMRLIAQDRAGHLAQECAAKRVLAVVVAITPHINGKKFDMSNTDIKINFTGSVNEENVRAFINEIKNLTEKFPDSTALTVYISSSGGNVDIAVELFNFLKLLDCKVRTVNTSCVNSAAIIIFAAGEERISLPCSSFYVHSITKELNGNFTADDLLREAREMLANTNKVATILAQTSNKNKSYWKRLMKKGCLLTSKKAKKLGLINDISEYK